MSWQLIAGWLQYVRVYFNQKSDKIEIGQGLVEYALILVTVAVVMVVLMALMGPAIRNIFANIVYHIDKAGQS